MVLGRVTSRQCKLICLLGMALVLAMGSTALAQSSKPILIGFYAPLSGPVALLGMPAKQAVDMAVAKANAAGGVNGRKIRVIFADTKADYSQSRQIVGRFVRADKVDAVIGSLTSPGTLSTLAQTARAGIPHMTFAANAS